MTHLVDVSGRPLSRRAQARVVSSQQLATRLNSLALEAFLTLGFWGRWRWLFFGHKAFPQTPSEELRQVVDEAKRRGH